MADLEKVCIAADFGGTKMLVGAVTPGGKIVASTLYKTGFRSQQQAAQAILQNLDAFIAQRAWGANDIAAVGIGLVGQIDFGSGTWYLMYDEPDDEPVPLAAMIAGKYGVPCAIDNDVKAALAAERVYGTGKSCGNFAYVNVGTGIAAGFVCDGRVVRGHKNDAGEIGHYVVDINSDAQCFCGQRGCVEALASGAGMLKRCRALAGQYPGSGVGRLLQQNRLDAVSLFALADEGDALALRIAQEAAQALAVLIGNVACTCAPQTIVFGGGLFNDNWLMEKTMAVLPKRLLESELIIKRTDLDTRTIGLKGAAVVGLAAEKREIQHDCHHHQKHG